jgi:hypothetical protein
MTKIEAINHLGKASQYSAKLSTEEIYRMLNLAIALQSDYKEAITAEDRRNAQRFYFSVIKDVDAHLTIRNND